MRESIESTAKVTRVAHQDASTSPTYKPLLNNAGFAAKMLQMQRHLGNRHVQRALGLARVATDKPATSISSEPDDATLSASLMTRANEVARIIAASRDKASQSDSDKEARDLQTAEMAVGRLQETASGGNRDEKLAVLAAFTPERLKASEPSQGQEQPSLSQDGSSPDSVQRSPARTSVNPRSSRGLVQRQVGGALVAAGASLLSADAEQAPLSAAAGPPAWAADAVVAVGALALIGAGYILMTAAGNQVDSGIAKDYGEAVSAAKLAGTAVPERCKWLEDNGGSYSKDRVKKTAKAWGCRHSRWS